MTDGPISAVLQSTVPPHVQGRVFGLLGSLFALTTPIGLAIAGPVGDALGVRFWFQLAGVMCLAVGLVSFFVPAVRTLEEHEFAEQPSEQETDTLGTQPVPSPSIEAID
jgi:DHA3 family macrolide efflux protein-like MFS transporter